MSVKVWTASSALKPESFAHNRERAGDQAAERGVIPSGFCEW